MLSVLRMNDLIVAKVPSSLITHLCHRFLSYLLTPKVAEAPSAEVREKEHHSRLQGAISSSIFSIGDLFKDMRDGSKSVKFPERLMKLLEQKVQDVAMKKDPACVLFVVVAMFERLIGTT